METKIFTHDEMVFLIEEIVEDIGSRGDSIEGEIKTISIDHDGFVRVAEYESEKDWHGGGLEEDWNIDHRLDYIASFWPPSKEGVQKLRGKRISAKDYPELFSSLNDMLAMTVL